MTSVTIVIVNFNTAQLVKNCLDSLVPEVARHGRCNVIIVDNGSSDDSIDQIEKKIQDEKWSSWIVQVQSGKNLGFAGGNNVALKSILTLPQPPDYIYLLNPDTLCFDGTITELSDFLDRHPDVGVVGGRSENLDGSIQVSAFRFHTIASEFETTLKLGLITRFLSQKLVPLPIQEKNHECDWVCGCTMMFRFDILKEIGPMDETYFLYYEEVDYCVAAKKLGWKIWHVPTSRIIHLVGQTTGVGKKDEKPKRRRAYWFFSRNYFFTKNYGRLYALLANIAWISGYSIWLMRKAIQNKKDSDPPFFLIDFIKYAFQPLWI